MGRLCEGESCCLLFARMEKSWNHFRALQDAHRKGFGSFIKRWPSLCAIKMAAVRIVALRC